MKTINFEGNCPQCKLYDEMHQMRENEKFWECPHCALQILVENNNASILRFRGSGDLKMNYKSYSGSVPMQETGLDSYPNDVQILTSKHLIEYLLLKVEQKPKYSIDNLIETYEDYKFKGMNSEPYLYQSHHFKIDFENEEIEDILNLRDKERNLSDQYSTQRMYHFLTENVFPKYHNADTSWLPEMGMSQLQFLLCEKHLPEKKRELIQSDRSFVRQSLKNFIKDLITIVYEGKDVVLTGDPQLMLKIKQEKHNTNLN